MTKRNERRRKWIEIGKDVLILLLTCSAIWMLLGSGLTHLSIDHLMGKEDETVAEQQEQSLGWAETVRPLRIVATISQWDQQAHYGVQYDRDAVDDLFQQTASLLAEALSNVQTPQQVARWRWMQALKQAPGLCFDFQGEMPLSVLRGWLSGDQSTAEATVRRLLLTAEQDSIVLYYYDLDTQSYYRGVCEVSRPTQLENVIAVLSSNGAFYAFESEAYSILAPETLLSEDIRNQPVFFASNPMADGRSALELLMEDMGFSLVGCSFYSADEEVARSGGETVRLDGSGRVEYRNSGEGLGHFLLNIPPEAEKETFAVVEGCRRLAAKIIDPRSGQAQLYLKYVEKTPQGWNVSFDYCLNTSPVLLKSGCAAEFVVENGMIQSFTIQFRNYQSSDQSDIVIPVPQAVAAVDALGLEGQELQLVYQDTGEERLSAQWVTVKVKE